MSNRKENIKRSRGITENLWSSDDEDLDMEEPNEREFELSNDINEENPNAENSYSSTLEEPIHPSRVGYQQLRAEMQNRNRQDSQRSRAKPSNGVFDKRVLAVDLQRIISYKRLKRRDGTSHRRGHQASASTPPIDLSVMNVRRSHPGRKPLPMLKGESIMSLVRRISGEPQSSTSRDLCGPLPSYQPSTSAGQSLPTTSSSSATQILPTTAASDAAPAIQTLHPPLQTTHAPNSLSVTKVASATQSLLSTDSLSHIQSSVADSAPASQSHLARNPISNTHFLALTTKLPSTCPSTYESVSTPAPTTTQEPTTTHLPAVAHVPIATDASPVPFTLPATQTSSSADAPAATLASPPTSTAPPLPRPLFTSGRSIYDILTSQIGYESPTTTNALSLTGLLFTTQAPSANQAPSTSSAPNSIHEPSTSYAPSTSHSHCTSHTPSISSAIHLPPTTITTTANGALPAFANDGAPPTTKSEQPTIGKYPLLPGIQQSTQSHDATDGDTRNLDVDMDVAHMEVVMSSSDGGCRPHEPHDFITLEPSDLAIASTSQPESRTRKRKRDDGDAGGETCTVKDFNKCLLRLLECPVCLEWIEPPIAQCRRGHLVCSRCRGRLSSCPICRTAFSSVRNRAMEGVADLVRYPCYYGCGRELRLRRRSAHEANCVARRYRCPAPACAQRAPLPLTELLEHLQVPQVSRRPPLLGTKVPVSEKTALP